MKIQTIDVSCYRYNIRLAALPAAAHEDHTSCGGGAPAVVEAFPELGIPPPGPGFGTLFVSPIARAGLAKTTIENLHAAYCADEPGDQPPRRPATKTQPK